MSQEPQINVGNFTISTEQMEQMKKEVLILAFGKGWAEALESELTDPALNAFYAEISTNENMRPAAGNLLDPIINNPLEKINQVIVIPYPGYLEKIGLSAENLTGLKDLGIAVVPKSFSYLVQPDGELILHENRWNKLYTKMINKITEKTGKSVLTIESMQDYHKIIDNEQSKH